MADKHLYPHGSQNQKHPQYSCGDYYNHLASQGVWNSGFYEGCTHLKKPSMVVIR
jgi:hypothetical protein